MVLLEQSDLALVASRTRAAYNSAADRYHELFHDELQQKPYDRELLEGIAAALPRSARVLDAGCGPCGVYGRFFADAGRVVTGVDLAEGCVVRAREHNPAITYALGDIAALPYRNESFDLAIAYYAVIDTPKHLLHQLFGELARVTKRGGLLLVAVKAGSTEEWMSELLGIEGEIYFALFSEEEIVRYLTTAGCWIESIGRRAPHDFEISNDRIFAVARRS